MHSNYVLFFPFPPKPLKTVTLHPKLFLYSISLYPKNKFQYLFNSFHSIILYQLIATKTSASKGQTRNPNPFFFIYFPCSFIPKYYFPNCQAHDPDMLLILSTLYVCYLLDQEEKARLGCNVKKFYRLGCEVKKQCISAEFEDAKYF